MSYVAHIYLLNRLNDIFIFKLFTYIENDRHKIHKKDLKTSFKKYIEYVDIE